MSEDFGQELREHNPEALFADGLEDAYIGMGQQFNHHIAVYDVNKVIQKFMRDGMTDEEALEHFHFNVVGAGMGVNTPLFLYRVDDSGELNYGIPTEKPPKIVIRPGSVGLN